MGNLPLLIDGKVTTGTYKPLILSGLVGLMLAAAFPKWQLAALAWVTPACMLALAMRQEGFGAFRVGYAAGLGFHLGSLYWLLHIPVPVAPILGWLALSAFLSLYQGLWVWLCWRIYPHAPDSKASDTPRERFLATTWPQQLTWALTCAALWVALEMVQARLFTGFPWNLLGASQYRMIPLIQVASITGVYGVSFLMVWLSLAIFSAVAVMIFRPTRPRDWMTEILPPVFILVIVVGFGLRQVLYVPENPPGLRVAMIQPSIPQTDIWDKTKSVQRFHDLVRLSTDALTNDVDMLLWPEAAAPNLFRYDTNIIQVVTNLVRRHGVWMALGSDDLVWRPGARDDSDYDYYNSAMLLAPDGSLKRAYHKRHLVMFGEYVPLAKWLPFLREFTQVHGDFSSGAIPVPFDLTNLKVKTSVLICFEDNFPHLVREYVTPDLDFLLNLTNNGWFGESAAQWQHAANAVFRAVENGLPLVRCTNNGLTCWVDQVGRLRDVFFKGNRDIYKSGFKIARIPILAGEKRVPTFYSNYGDVFGWGCVAWSAVMVLVRAPRTKFRI